MNDEIEITGLPNYPEDSPENWQLYFSCDPRDIAIDFLERNITRREDVAKFIEDHAGYLCIDVNLICYYIEQYRKDNPIYANPEQIALEKEKLDKFYRELSNDNTPYPFD